MYYIAKDDFIRSMYIGDGHKYATHAYYPKFPYLIQAEPDTLEEHEDVRTPNEINIIFKGKRR